MTTPTATKKVSGLGTTRARVARLRDQLHLEAHLMRAEVRDEWERLEERWPELQRTVNRLDALSDAAGSELQEAALLLGDELALGYERLRRVMGNHVASQPGEGGKRFKGVSR